MKDFQAEFAQFLFGLDAWQIFGRRALKVEAFPRLPWDGTITDRTVEIRGRTVEIPH